MVFEEETGLPDGTGVIVTPVEPPRGSPQAVLAGLKKARRISRSIGDELRRNIKEGKLPARFKDPLSTWK